MGIPGKYLQTIPRFKSSKPFWEWILFAGNFLNQILPIKAVINKNI